MEFKIIDKYLPSNFGKYFKNTLWLIAENGLGLIISFIVGIMLTNYMTKEEFGFYSYASSLVLIFSVFSNLGLSSVLVKNILNDIPKQQLLGTAFIIKSIGALIAFIILISFLLLTNTPSHKIILILIFASSIFFKGFDVISAYFDANVLSKYSVYARISALVLNNILKLFIILFKLPVEWVYFTFIFDAILFVSILSFFYQKQNLKIKDWSFDKEILRKLLSSSWPLMLSIVATTIYLKVDQVMITHILGNEANANYAASEKITSIFYTFPFILGTSLFPSIINSRNKSIALFDKRYATLLQFLVFCGLLISIGISFLSSDIISFLFKNQYQASSAILKVHIWSSIIVFVNYASTRWIVAEGLEFYAMINSSIGLALNILFNLIFIKEFGVIGAAYATLLSQFIACYIVPVFLKSTRKLFFTQIISTIKGPFLLFNIKGFLKSLQH
jgi:O-antigen/teichoic acid export membrane protein